MIGRLLILAMAFIGVASAAPLTETVQKVQASVVAVGIFQPMAQPNAMPLGTGFVIADGRTIVTNHHVIARLPELGDKARAMVFIGRGSAIKTRMASILATDPVHDIAILEIEGEALPALRLAAADNVLPEGSDIAITGYPLGSIHGLYPATYRGIVAAITPNAVPQPTARSLSAAVIKAARFDVYQLDLTAFPGHSGSPVYDTDTGLVHAIVNSGFVKETKDAALSNPSGLTFAIPVKWVQQLLSRNR